MATFFDDYQRHLHERRWTWDDIPFYEGRGARQSIAPLHDLDYLDVYERVYGRKLGCNGIGKLREVALTHITEVPASRAIVAGLIDQSNRGLTPRFSFASR